MFNKTAAFHITQDAVHLTCAKSRFSSVDFAAFDTEPCDGSDTASISAALIALAGRNQLAGFRVVTSLPAHKSMVKEFTFPFTDRRKIDEVVLIEAEDAIPVALDELACSYQIMNKGPEGATVLFAAAERDAVNAVLAAFDGAGMKVEAVYHEPYALYHLSRITSESASYIHVDLGRHASIVNIVTGGVLVHSRVLNTGIHDALKPLLGRKDDPCAFEKVLYGFNPAKKETASSAKIVRKLAIKPAQLQKFSDSFTDHAAKTARQIAGVLKAFEKNGGALAHDRILLSGNSGYTEYFAGVLYTATDIPVYDLSAASLAPGGQNAYIYNISTGIAVADILNPDQINFMTSGTTDAPKLLSLKGLPVVMTVGALLIFLIFLISSTVYYGIRGSANDRMVSQQYRQLFRTAPPTGDPIADARKILETEKKQLSSISAIIPKERSLLANLDEVLRDFQSDPSFLLRDVTVNDKQIVINGEVGDSARLDEFKNKLKQSGRYSSVDLNTNFSGKTSVRFTITVKMKDAGGKR